MFKKILTPLDDTVVSQSILKYVASLAGRLGAEVTLFSVVDPRLEGYTSDPWTDLDSGDVATQSSERCQGDQQSTGGDSLKAWHTPLKSSTGRRFFCKSN
jgi:hypothetical protein